MSMTVIEHIEVGSGGAASIDFVSVGDIPADYTDLQILVSARSDRSGFDNDPLFVEFNGDTGATYTVRALRGSGSAAVSFTETDIWIAQIPAATATGSTFANVSVYIPNYLSSNPKSISADGVGENNATAAYQMITAGLWDAATDAAITSIKIYAQNGNLVQYSSATLFGITAGSSGGVTVS